MKRGEAMRNYEINTNSFYLRPGEEFTIQNHPPSDLDEYIRVYAVALIDTPPVPFEGEQGIHKTHKHEAVIAAEVYPTVDSGGKYKIGWVNLGPDTKESIGCELLSVGAKSGEWFFLLLDTRKHK